MPDTIVLDQVPAPHLDPAAFRSVMRSLAASVTVVTTAHEGVLRGLTATAMCSVSAEPPTVLVVVNRSAQSHGLIAASQFFIVNILADDQQWLAEQFGSKTPTPFAGVGYRHAPAGGPVLHGTAGYLECSVIGANDVGTHTIFVGVVNAGARSGRLPLLYHDGRYGLFAPLLAAAP